MKSKLSCAFEDIVGVENLLEAWREFIKGKRARRDVQEFSLRLMDNILSLHRDCINHTYRHGSYQAFNISDPKPRNIHKATVRDRLLHHAIHRKLYPFFDTVFIADTFSCRLGKGTHKAIDRFRLFAYIVSKNHTRTCWVLKCDIRKFFANIDHRILLDILKRRIADDNVLWLLGEVIRSFKTKPGVGLPLGNLTSQLFVNVYMNEFDQFAKHTLKARYYIRYADDFVVFSASRRYLEEQLHPIGTFLRERLGLELHPDKVFIKTISAGIDFLGWVHFPDHRVLRTATKRRMLKRIHTSPTTETLNSYLGLLKHGNARKITTAVRKEYLLSVGDFVE
jgi:retron-type reverse transcriptase